MPGYRGVMAVLAVVAGAAGLVGLSACGQTSGTATAKDAPFELELINEDTGLNRLTLAAGPAQRIGIETEPVAALNGTGGTTIPYAALLYGAEGNTFVYTNPEPLVFMRHPVTVASIDGDTVALAAGPPAGTEVVTVGGSELTGIEFGVGK